MAKHPCAFKHCDRNATALVVDKHPEHTLFQHGAGLVCEQHATECEDKGVRVKVSRLTRYAIGL